MEQGKPIKQYTDRFGLVGNIVIVKPYLIPGPGGTTLIDPGFWLTIDAPMLWLAIDQNRMDDTLKPVPYAKAMWLIHEEALKHYEEGGRVAFQKFLTFKSIDWLAGLGFYPEINGTEYYRITEDDFDTGLLMKLDHYPYLTKFEV